MTKIHDYHKIITILVPRLKMQDKTGSEY